MSANAVAQGALTTAKVAADPKTRIITVQSAAMPIYRGDTTSSRSTGWLMPRGIDGVSRK